MIDNIIRETSINEIAYIEINYINNKRKEVVENVMIRIL